MKSNTSDYIEKLESIDENFLFKKLLSTTSDSIYFKDKESRIIHCSRHLAKKHGVKNPDDLIGKTDFDLFSKEHAQRAYADEQKIMRTGEPIIDIEEKETYHDGSIRWSSTSKFPLVSPNNEIIGTYGISRDITAQKLAEQELKAINEQVQQALKQNKMLLAEVHHRVKNNLAVILGLIELQVYKLMDTNDVIPEVLSATKTRIKSIANIHELLYQTENFSEIGFHELIKKLTDDIKATFNSSRLDVEFELDIDHIVLNTSQAVPLCLLMHELIQNSYKHAFKYRNEGTITIQASIIDKHVEVIYSDDGSGVESDFNEVMNSSNSLGLSLISALAAQLNAEHGLLDQSKGFTFQFRFNVDKLNNTEILSS